MRIPLTFLFISALLTFNSCCIGVKEDYLGNNIYLSEYDNVDRRILYQNESCATSGIEIVPITVNEISHNSNWIIAKSGNKNGNENVKYWVIKNNYKNIPDAETVKKNTTEFDDAYLFEYYLKNNDIKLPLEKKIANKTVGNNV
ncbi:hypothetical protein [Aequorivita xiaoshiensis]|uniref:Uncharacterized protein n=1 Tax=Aequorivita xiaoshiensis TaxID=2874476 RepID=A0A9X1UE32_9FLAO|nr:hypothetical protein [Aequorivita xiaoshiensis]MCG2432226.1 hypothetical protein [Aequorivita xiaoshiensis]